MNELDEDAYREILRVAKRAIVCRATGQDRAVSLHLESLASRGSLAVFAAAYAWARTVKTGVDPEGFAALELINPRTGERVEPEDGPEMAPMLWAARMVTAAHNEDYDAAWALFCAGLFDKRISGPSLLCLLDLATCEFVAAANELVEQIAAAN